MKKVSIIIPVYNVSSYLCECLDSVIVQTYENLEIILINDGSTDSSGKICEDYKSRDDRIVLINQENCGAANAKNAGLDIMTGDYFTFVDSDDIIAPDRVETAVRVLEENGAEVVECGARRLFADGEGELDAAAVPKGVYTAEEYLDKYLYSWSASLFWNKLFTARLSGDIRFRRERRCIDDEFYTYKLIANAKHVVKIDDCLCYYRQRLSSAVYSEKNHRQKTDDALEIMIERYRYIIGRYPRLRKTYLVHGSNILHYFANEFLFDDVTAKKLKRVGRYYLKQLLLHPCGLSALKNTLSLLRIPKSRLLANQPKSEEYDKTRYFV